MTRAPKIGLCGQMFPPMDGVLEAAQRAESDAGINELALFNFAAACEPEYAAHWDGLASDLLTRLGHAPLRTGLPVEAVGA